MLEQYTDVGNVNTNGKMSYNWTSAATAKGRERLKELLESEKCVFVVIHGREGILYNVLRGVQNPFGREVKYNLLMRLDSISKPFEWYIENGIEFLDPEPPAPVVDEIYAKSPLLAVDAVLSGRKPLRSALHNAYCAGFNQGVNEGPFPKNGTFDEFNKWAIGAGYMEALQPKGGEGI